MCSKSEVLTMKVSTIFPHFPLQSQRGEREVETRQCQQTDLWEKSRREQGKKGDAWHGFLVKDPVLYSNF